MVKPVSSYFFDNGPSIYFSIIGGVMLLGTALMLAKRLRLLLLSDGLFDLASPNFFGGSPSVFRTGSGRQPIDVTEETFGRPNRLDHVGQQVADFRGAGLVELAINIRENVPHRTGPELILHAVEVMEAIMRSSDEKRAVDIRSSCSRPAPIDAVKDAQLIELTASPYDLESFIEHAKKPA